MATKLKPSAFFARLDLSALDNTSANYVKEELIGDPDIDMLEGSELMDSIIDALKEHFPASLVNMPDDLKGEEPEEKPASTPEPELTVESHPTEVPPVIEEPKVPTTEERITYLETKITGFKALLSLAKTEESKATLKKKIQGFEALINLQKVKMDRGGNTDKKQLKKQKEFLKGKWIVFYSSKETGGMRERYFNKDKQEEAEAFAKEHNSQAFQYADGGTVLGGNGDYNLDKDWDKTKHTYPL